MASIIGQYLITFREAFEIALIIAIIIAYLARTGRRHLVPYVWYGVVLSLIVSLILGVVLWSVYGVLPKTYQLLFEAAGAYVAVIVLTSAVYWMATRGRHIREEIEKHIEGAVSQGAKLGLVALSFTVTFREGLEMVIFLLQFFLEDVLATLAGVALGSLTALLLSFGILVLGMKINLRRFFFLSSVLLTLIAGGLAGYGTHELLEYLEHAGLELGWLAEPAYDLGVPEESPFHHKGLIGSGLAVILGYTVKAEWARVIVHTLYLIVALPTVIRVYKQK
jgi:high-affinity iron transporter